MCFVNRVLPFKGCPYIPSTLLDFQGRPLGHLLYKQLDTSGTNEAKLSIFQGHLTITRTPYGVLLIMFKIHNII